MKLGFDIMFTGALMNDMKRIGLAGAAIVFTMAGFLASLVATIVIFTVQYEWKLPATTARPLAAVAWVACMAGAWITIARERKNWPDNRASTSLFHAFQWASFGIVALLAFVFGKVDSQPFHWFALIIEGTVTLFFFSYLFLGLTLRYQMPRSSTPAFVIAIVAAWHAGHKIPGLW